MINKVTVTKKVTVLENEISLIKDKNLQDWVRKTLSNTPDYFFTAAASSTGKYHPACTIKEGGLIVHVQRAVYIANRLCDGWGITGVDRDIVIASVILHDIAKSGKGSGSYLDFQNHPLNAEKYFAEESEAVGAVTVNLINECIRNHMGLWTPAPAKKPIKDYSLLELMVYTADYLSATKDLTTPVDGE